MPNEIPEKRLIPQQKLIRDGIAERILNSPEASKITKCRDTAEFDGFLRKKIIEEAVELARASIDNNEQKMIEEAGDILDVLSAMLKRRGIDFCQVAESQLTKGRREKRFEGRYLLMLDQSL